MDKQAEKSDKKVEYNTNEPEAVKKTILNHHFSSLRGHWKKVAFLLVCYDILAVNLSYFLALWLRFDCKFNFRTLSLNTVKSSISCGRRKRVNENTGKQRKLV